MQNVQETTSKTIADVFKPEHYGFWNEPDTRLPSAHYVISSKGALFGQGIEFIPITSIQWAENIVKLIEAKGIVPANHHGVTKRSFQYSHPIFGAENVPTTNSTNSTNSI